MTDKNPVPVVGPAGNTSVAPVVAPPSTSAATRLMAIPHIVTAIIQYARRDRSTLASLMRLDTHFYKEVAPLLYHTVAIWEETIDSFFRGSFKPCRCDECLKDLKDRWGIDHANGGLTEYGKMFNKPHGYGKYTNPAPRPKTPTEDAEDTLLASPSKSSTTSSFSPSTPKDEKTSKPENDKSDRKSKQGQKSTVSKDPENKPRASDNDDEPEITLPISKKDLLRMVRVFTLGSHHESGCEIYSEEVEEFMQGVEILRILETPCAPHRTFHICENCPGGSCPLIDTLNPRKIVVRNVSGLSVPFPAMWKANSKTKELVFVLPTKMMSYTGTDGCPSEGLVKSLLGQFTGVDVIRVVFWPEWDESLTHHPLARKLVGDVETRAVQKKMGGKPLSADYIATVMHALTKTRRLDPWDFRRPRVDYYGFSTTILSTYGKSMLVEEHKKHHGDAEYDLHSLAKHWTMRKEIGFVTNSAGGGFVTGSCDEVSWFTIDNYKRKEFKSEINECDYV